MRTALTALAVLIAHVHLLYFTLSPVSQLCRWSTRDLTYTRDLAYTHDLTYTRDLTPGIVSMEHT